MASIDQPSALTVAGPCWNFTSFPNYLPGELGISSITHLSPGGAPPHPMKQEMPIYEYRCQNCGKIFEKFRKMSDSDAGVQCPYCLAEEVERLLSAFATSGCGSSAGRSRFT